MKTPVKRQHVSSQARFVRSALKALELMPAHIVNQGGDTVKNHLSAHEYEALSQALRHVVREVRARDRLPRSVNFEGMSLRLSYSNFGRVFIVSRRTGRALVSSRFGVLW